MDRLYAVDCRSINLFILPLALESVQMEPFLLPLAYHSARLINVRVSDTAKPFVRDVLMRVTNLRHNLFEFVLSKE